MYGLHEPISYNFKTPFKTYITNKIILHPQFQGDSTSSTSSAFLFGSKSRTSVTGISVFKTAIAKRSRTRKGSLSKIASKSLASRDSIGALFRDLLKSSTPTRKASRTRSYNSTRKAVSSLKHRNISLMNPLFPFNNQLMQVGRLIDSRRDFDKPLKKATDKCDPQTELYDKLKHQLRYYKGEGVHRKVPNFAEIVKSQLGDRSISQAWLKMYEMIIDCNLVPTNKRGTFTSYHLCEAPGTFINALNNFIHTKTQYDKFEWHAQSLNTSYAKIGDQFGLIKRYPHRWDWGADGTGDITNIENIKYYRDKLTGIRGEKIKEQQQKDSNTKIDLMTSDCGLEWGNPKYELVAFASYVAILNMLPRGGTMLYKILSPIDIPLIWNLIYITYTNFKEMTFFKPIQNAQSREFYIIAKDYLGTDKQVLDKLLDIVARWRKLEKTGYKAPWLENLDLFNDTYPEEFVYQVLEISERLTNNYVNSIERIIYYVDNYELLGDDYKRHIEGYIAEKNEDWLQRYKPKKLEYKKIL
jgi:hypothetical protein